jgi:hypothetical protein
MLTCGFCIQAQLALWFCDVYRVYTFDSKLNIFWSCEKTEKVYIRCRFHWVLIAFCRPTEPIYLECESHLVQLSEHIFCDIFCFRYFMSHWCNRNGFLNRWTLCWHVAWKPVGGYGCQWIRFCFDENCVDKISEVKYRTPCGSGVALWGIRSSHSNPIGETKSLTLWNETLVHGQFSRKWPLPQNVKHFVFIALCAPTIEHGQIPGELWKSSWSNPGKELGYDLDNSINFFCAKFWNKSFDCVWLWIQFRCHQRAEKIWSEWKIVDIWTPDWGLESKIVI